MGCPARIQGTDGVRGEVAATDDPRLKGSTPLEAFIRRGLITPPFVQLYCYAYVKELLEAGLASPGDSVVVGFDPRDRDRRLVRAAIDGVAKAGVVPVNVGVMPTPGVGIYMVASGAAGAVMITASHNPPDQNGVKLFLPGGLKLFPADEERLTGRIYSLEEFDLDAASPQHQAVDGAAGALAKFEEFFQDPYNSWIESGGFGETLLVIDAANGALAGIAGPILQCFGFGEIEEVGAAADGSVNVNCGAGMLEGHSRIGPDFVSDAGVGFRTMELVQALFHHGRNHREDLRRGRMRVSGAAFDADADRFYRLEYDPFSDSVLVLSGDETAYHQAWFLRRKLGDGYNGASAFATTVESDINAAVAAEGLGFIPVHTGVGDKWLLWAAGCHLLGTYWEVLNNNIDDMAVLARVEERENQFIATGEPDALRLTGLLDEAEAIAAEHGLDIGALAQDPELMTFAIGSEETGHTITAGRVVCAGGSQRIVYFGNGLKSAVNSFAATRELAEEVDGEEYYRRLHHPFPPGYKRTIPVYYTERALLRQGSGAWKALEQSLLKGSGDRFGGLLIPELRPCEEEPDMIYLALYDGNKKGDDPEAVTRAAVFVRNSGTEEKTSVYLRGDPRFSSELGGLGEEMAVRLAVLMKRGDSPYARAERAVLRRLAEAGSAPFSDLEDLTGEVNAERLLVEMSIKEGLLALDGGDEKLALTELGRRVQRAIAKEEER